MHDTPTQSSDRLDQIIAEYLAAEESGAAPPPADVIAANPDLTDELRRFFANREELAVALPGEPPRKQFVPPKVRYFGDYELLDEIARGGMGVVYRAMQTSLNRVVAIKMILSGHLAGEEDVKRFRTEAEAAANLKHPGIVPVHEVGVHEGHHYFSMDYIKGRSLAEIVRENPLPARKASEYVRSIADAVQYAHQQGTLHRDLKPSNILIDAGDAVHVTDFGLAVRVEGDSELTRTGQILGTPAYMPPEQAQSKRGLIGPGSDVYALGAILYELLTGRPPFRGESAVETLKLVIEAEPVSPRLLNPKTPRDLETICLKCLQKEPHKRYLTAEELSDELGRFLAGELIRARPVGRIERAWRWCRRKPAAAGLLTSIMLLVIGVIAGALWYVNDRGQRRLADLQRVADENQRLAVEAAEEASRLDLVEQRIENALVVAGSHHARALTLTERPTEWGAVLASARAEYRQAAAEIVREGEKIDPALRNRVETLGRELNDDERDQQLATRFEEIRLEVADIDIRNASYIVEDTFPRLQAALADVGFHVGTTPISEAADFLRGRPTAVQTTWIAALDYCLIWAPRWDEELSGWLLEVLKTVDSEPWRNDLRKTFIKPDQTEFARLAERAEVDAQPTWLLLELARWLISLRLDEEGLSLATRLHAARPGDIWVNLSAAQALVNLGRLEESLRFRHGALAARPDNAGIWLNYGETLLKLEDLDGAEAAFRCAIELEQEFPAAYSNLGIVFWNRDQADAAADAFQTAIRLKPDYPAAHSNLGIVLQSRGDLDGAIDEFRIAASLPSAETGIYYHFLGDTLEASGDLPGAISAFQQATARGDSAPFYEAAALQAYLGDMEGYRTTCQSLFKRHSASEDPQDIRRLLIAHLLVPEGARPELFDIARRHLADDPAHAWILALAHYRLRDNDDTWPVPKPEPEAVQDLDPHTRICYLLSGTLLELRAGRLQEAVKYASGARRIQEVACGDRCPSRPWDPERFLWHEVAAGLAAVGLDEALPILPPTYPEYLPSLIVRFRQAVDRDPRFSPAYLNLGNALLVSGDVEGAIAQYQRAIEVDPAHARSFTRLGNAYLRRGAKGDDERAIAAFRTTTELLPRDPRACADLGMTLRRSGRLAEAVEVLERVFELHPRYSQDRSIDGYRQFEEWWIAFVKTCLAAGQPERAIASCRQQIADYPDEPRLFPELAGLLHYIGDADGYRAACREMLTRFRTGSQQTITFLLMSHLYYPEGEVTPEVMDLVLRNANDQWLSGLAYYRSGQDELAVETLRQALAPPAARGGPTLSGEGHVMAQLGLALVQLRRGQPEEARAAIIAARTAEERFSRVDYWSSRQPWRAIPSLWREVQAEMEPADLVEPVAELAPTCAESVMPDADSLKPGALVYRTSVVRDDLAGAVGIDISADGRFVYAASHKAHTVTVFERNPVTGHLTHLQTNARADGLLDGVVSIQLSKDDDNNLVATAAYRNGTVALFERDANTGMLTELDVAHDGERGVSGLGVAVDAAFSSDSQFLYVAGARADRLVWFRIQEKRLEFVGAHPGENECFDNPREVRLSPDGEWLYVVSAAGDALTVLTIDPVTGTPTIESITRNGDVAASGNVIDGLDGAFSLVCSDDGHFVYTNSGRFGGDNAVCVFMHGNDGPVFLEAHRNGLDGIQGLGGGQQMVISPDGMNLYALGTTANAIACFNRDPDSGRLTYRRRLINDTGGVGPLGLPAGIAISPDGRHVYVTAEGDGAISIFERR